MDIYNIYDIKGRKAVITGAGRGIGKVLAIALAEAGCDIALLGLHLENLEEVETLEEEMEEETETSDETWDYDEESAL